MHRTVPAPAELGTVVIGVPEGSDLELDLLLEAVTEGVLVSGTVHGRLVGECVRCLDEVLDEIEVTVSELFVYPERAAVAVEDGGEAEQDMRELDGDLLDFDPALRDALVPVLPFQPLCRPDCAGLCPQCGVRLDDEPGHTHETLDPRWAALSGLTGQDDETRES